MQSVINEDSFPMSDSDFDAKVVQYLTSSQDALRAYIFRHVLSLSDTDDILQETNIVIWKKRNEWDANSVFLKWAYRIAYFQSKAFMRDKGRMSRRFISDEVLELVAVEEPEKKEDITENLSSCLEALPKEQFRLLQLRYWNNISVQCISEEEGVSSNVISQKLRRIRLQLMNCLRKKQKGDKE